ncbi:PREDICTED: LOW QUALITY PROTEIN: myc target protein 1 [Hipposideros armiger]|uniref:LOW QUALITY PROTEIN: myc target protein 1 n=1 Tax=Hipposideros armiger TaxID=186990 RepID=A0A8B7QQL4_HIPAR|nr:PREDICTED: LOW QUALITY PROTEIN: myc target protein 1 [Hipposideros armiger]
MQTQVYEGLCENYYSPEPQRHRNKVLLLDILAFFLSFFLLSLLFLVDIMATNTTSSGSLWPENFWDELIISFTVSMAIGLVIGGFIWALFVCLSRRRASARISQWSSSRRSRSSYTHGLNRTGFYRHSGCERRSNLSLASLTFQRQASLEQGNSFPRKSSFRASTFHPFLQSPPLPVETDSQLMTLPSSSTSSTANTTHSLSRPDFHWSSNSLRAGFSPPPPPPYELIMKAFPDS